MLESVRLPALEQLDFSDNLIGREGFDAYNAWKAALAARR